MTVEQNQALCACSRVRYRPIELGGGRMRSCWKCDDCGTEFVKAISLDELTRERDEARAEVERLKSLMALAATEGEDR